MADDVFVEGDENHLLAVGREVREPVVEFAKGDLLLVGALSEHTPDLHVSGALGVEIDVAAVGRIFGAVVEAFGGGETGFTAAFNGDGVDVEVFVALTHVALADESERFAVRRPAVPVGGGALRNALGSATS